MIKAIIFDMDGLIIDSERVTYEGYIEVMKKINYHITKDFYVTLLGRPITVGKDLFTKEYGNDFPFDTVLKEVHEYIEDTFDKDGIPLKKGLITLLGFLKENNYKTIVATSSQKKRAKKILTNANIIHYFDDMICGDEVTKGKPNPEIFLSACKKLGVSVSDTIVLEDSQAGIEAGYDGNIKVICIPDMLYPDEEHQKMTYKIVDSLDQIIPILKKCED